MDKVHLDKSTLENYKISIGEVGGCPCAGRITHAVIELSGDISPAMPIETGKAAKRDNVNKGTRC